MSYYSRANSPNGRRSMAGSTYSGSRASSRTRSYSVAPTEDIIRDRSPPGHQGFATARRPQGRLPREMPLSSKAQFDAINNRFRSQTHSHVNPPSSQSSDQSSQTRQDRYDSSAPGGRPGSSLGEQYERWARIENEQLDAEERARKLAARGRARSKQRGEDVIRRSTSIASGGDRQSRLRSDQVQTRMHAYRQVNTSPSGRQTYTEGMVYDAKGQPALVAQVNSSFLSGTRRRLPRPAAGDYSRVAQPQQFESRPDSLAGFTGYDRQTASPESLISGGDRGRSKYRSNTYPTFDERAAPVQRPAHSRAPSTSTVRGRSSAPIDQVFVPRYAAPTAASNARSTTSRATSTPRAQAYGSSQAPIPPPPNSVYESGPGRRSSSRYSGIASGDRVRGRTGSDFQSEASTIRQSSRRPRGTSRSYQEPLVTEVLEDPSEKKEVTPDDSISQVATRGQPPRGRSGRHHARDEHGRLIR